MPKKSPVMDIAESILNLPTAPFREAAVRDEILKYCRSRKLATRDDDMGNIIVSVGAKSKQPVMAFVAHMDHPGFIIEKNSSKGTTTALFYGGVEESYFAGERVRIYRGQSEVIGHVEKIETDRQKRIQRVWLKVDGPVRRGELGMWDLPVFEVRRGKIYSRACDDLIGCAALLALLDQVKGMDLPCGLLAIFTVAEEAGLHGAKFLCMNKQIPKDANIISIEASSARGRAKMGGGAIIRVGDSRSLFDPQLTGFITHVARDLYMKGEGFRFQRKLMDGGRCEGSIFHEFGYRSSGICVPLGNYHNRDFNARKIAPEYVSVKDVENMVRLFRGVVDRAGELPGFLEAKPPRLKEEVRELGERMFE